MEIQKVFNYNRDISDLFPTAIQAGEVGIEVEIEGNNLPTRLPSYWAVHDDHSLRGPSAEYVLNKPAKREHTANMLKYLKAKLDGNAAEINQSQRTSVHIHLNCQGLTVKQIYNHICTYLMVEDLLVDFAGDSRVGNVFCLRAKDAEYLVRKLSASANLDQYHMFQEQEKLRYSSINTCALGKFNSLEFRALRGTVDPVLIETWIQLLLAVKDASKKYDNPRDIVGEFSRIGVDRFLEDIFNPQQLKQLVPNIVQERERVFQSMRLVQEIAYATEWEKGTILKKRSFPPHYEAKVNQEEIHRLRLEQAQLRDQDRAQQRLPPGINPPGWMVHNVFGNLRPPAEPIPWPDLQPEPPNDWGGRPNDDNEEFA